MEQAIEFTAGIVFLVIGLSCLFRTNDWVTWLAHVRQEGRRKALSLGSIGLLLSALIVGFHPVWSGPSMLLTIIGVAGILEGTLYLLYPGSLNCILSFYEPRYKPIIRLFSLIMVLFGTIILYGWWEQL